jgi:prepilin-type N-terminal cleavage/methylation domain-containing protein
MSIKKLQKGFTLVELMVSMALFVTVVTISLGSVLGIFNANSKSQSIASVMNNLNYSLDNMTRNIRFSNAYHCGSTGTLTTPQNCTDNVNGDTSFAVSSSTDLVVYNYDGSTITRSVNGGAPISVIGSEVIIDRARFFVFNTATADNQQPYILMVLRGHAGTKLSNQSYFDIQTVISERQLDI